MMTGKFKTLLTAVAAVVLATALLAPIADASGTTPGGMMGSPSPLPTMMGTPTPTPSPSPTGATWGDSWCGGGMWGGILMMILAPIAAMLIQMTISRSREYDADAASAKYVGSPYPLINGLQKLEGWSKRIPMDASPATAHMFIIKPFTGEAVMRLFSTHPATKDRIARLQAMR